MFGKLREAKDCQRFQKCLHEKLKGCIQLPFEKDLWDYRTLVERKKSRKYLRVINALTRLYTSKKMSKPFTAEDLMKEIDDSDSSYGRDEAVLYEGYYIIDKIYNGCPGRKLYLCQKSFFSKRCNKEQIAVRVIKLTKTFDNYVYDILPNELDVILRLRHPFIIETHCVLYRRKQYFIFMRYAEKSDLFSYLVEVGPIREAKAKVWIAQMGNALTYLHSLEIAHRDVCCENILITQHNNLKLTDFENAVTIQYDIGKAVPMTDFRGTLEYANPEILKGRPYQAKGADTWALGVVLYAMLTVHLPFAGNNPHSLLKSQQHWKMPNPEKHSSLLTRLLDKVFMFDTKHRYNLERLMNSDWIKKDRRFTDYAFSKEAVGAARPVDDPGRLRFIDDPAQEHTDGGEVVRFKPFARESDSDCTDIPCYIPKQDEGDSLSEDLSYGVPFSPGEEHKMYLGKLATIWERKKIKKTKSKKK